MATGDVITLDLLGAHGLTVEDVRQRCPGAVEYVGLDGNPCWRAEDLQELMRVPTDETFE